jgi:hypothetical protein
MAIRARHTSTRCGHCQRLVTGRPYSPSGGPFGDNDYCSFECAHAAGNRDDCKPGCGCTGFERMCNESRMLRESMQVMDDIIMDHNLTRELIHCSDAAGVYVWDTAPLPEEGPDPEKVLQAEVEALRSERGELQSLQTITSLAAAALDYGAVVRDMERARMALEDSRGLR